MNEEHKKRLINWLGEKWHYLENDAEITCACGEKWTVRSIDIEKHENRDFTTPDDFFACFNRLVELGEWLKFFAFAHEIVNTDECNAWSWDMDEPKHWAELSQWLHSRTESGEFRLCRLVAEWLVMKGR